MSLVNEMSRSLSIKVIASLENNREDIDADENLKQILEKGSRGRFDLSISIDKPNADEIRDQISRQIEKINVVRINEEFNIEELISVLENSSRIEVLNFLNDYFSASLLIQGKLFAVNDFVKFKQTGKLDLELEESKAEIA